MALSKLTLQRIARERAQAIRKASNPRMAHSVLGLALALTALDRAKERNAPFREVMVWEDACKVLAERAVARIMYFAIDAARIGG